MTQWTVLGRSECSLCEQLLVELAEELSPAEAAQVRVVDVDQEPDLARKYGHRIPVLLADGEFVCDYRLDRERVRLHRPQGA
ncbi:MAG TPA: glutaredoxin family protein [Steroidobacter sp.]|uniref:glutaredoxin family protein n=1 Tax=Steroidobacter sp. TaxID=1978227 RepID=UPI002EDB6A97